LEDKLNKAKEKLDNIESRNGFPDPPNNVIMEETNALRQMVCVIRWYTNDVMRWYAKQSAEFFLQNQNNTV